MSPAHDFVALDVFHCELGGIRQIEASAGTGKTWNICGLYLRLLLERGLEVQRILVVTFTNAATSELRERIRQRIVDTLAFLQPGRLPAAGGGDDFVPRLVAAMRERQGLTDEAMAGRLELALATFDEASIFTIHGFCQRALADTPFTAQMPLALELVQDDGPWVSEAANDFWRRVVAADDLDPGLAAHLVASKDSPQRFAELLKRHLSKPLARSIWPDELERVQRVDSEELDAAHAHASELWSAHRDAIEDLLMRSLGALSAVSYKEETVRAALAGWAELLRAPDGASALGLAPPKLDLLGSVRLAKGTKKKMVTPEHAFFDAAQYVIDLREKARSALALQRLALLRTMLAEGATAQRDAKRRQRVIAFDDMLFNLHERLTDGDSPWLASALKVRFPAALIDEFQDTDPLQFAIFRTIYTAPDQEDAAAPRPSAGDGGSAAPRPSAGDGGFAAPRPGAGDGSFAAPRPGAGDGSFAAPRPGAGDGGSAAPRPSAGDGGSAAPLFFVGDPKQAIYSFRNADLHTYLAAGRHAVARYSLSENQRSVGPLIHALNRLFMANGRAFMQDGLDYQEIRVGAKPRKPLVDTSVPEPVAPLQVWTLPDDPDSGEPMFRRDAKAAAVGATAGEIARLLAAAQRGEVLLGGQPLSAGDIAVLVRSNADGSLMRQALAALGVGSVELSQDSVFRSPDAEDLDRLLCAILEPARERKLKAALATEAMGYDAAAIAALADDESALLATVQRFAAWRDTWAQRGVGFMLRQWLVAEGVAGRLLSRPDGERRLTNLLHLVECLHEAGAAHATPDTLLRWFQTQRLSPEASDATQLRLESDRHLVQIVTIHKSKGLEYPIVFCPFLWSASAGGSRDKVDGVAYHDDAGEAVIDYGLAFADDTRQDDVKQRLRLAESAETLRLVYVALTRAVHRCVLVAGCYRVPGKNPHATGSTRSLLNWLVAGDGLSPEEWFEHKLGVAPIKAAWEALAAGSGGAIAVTPLPRLPGKPLRPPRPSPDTLAALPAPRTLSPGWWIGSFSALAHGATHERSGIDHDLRAIDPVDRPETDDNAEAIADDDALNFPRGAAAGECIHQAFERIDFTAPDTWPEHITQAVRTLRALGVDDKRRKADAATTPSETDALRERMLQRLVRDVMDTPLPLGTDEPLKLATLPAARKRVELEFHLPSHALDAGALSALLAAGGYEMPRLAFPTLRGFLKGFIDLVFEHEGRYFVLDWKSNHLGDTPAAYGLGPMAEAMASHGYHLQALLYLVALDRYLAQRVPGYRREDHLGGAVYLFVRGVRPGWRDAAGAPAGIFFHRPADATIARLSALFDDVPVTP